MARAVGIDIGSRSLKILQLEKTGGKLRISHFSHFELPLGSDYNANPDLLIEPMRRVFREHGLDRSNLALSIPTQDSILREIAIDFTQDEHINKIIKYEAEKYLHSYPIEEVIIDYQKLQVYDNRSKLFVAAVPKEILAQRLGILTSSDLDPISVDLDISALANVARLCPDVIAKKMVLLLDFGATSTKILILREGKIQHVRATRLGANIQREKIQKAKPDVDSFRHSQTGDVDWDIEDQLIISLPVADGVDVDRMVLVQNSDEDSAAIEEQRQEIFQRLSQEIRRTMLTVQLEDPIELMCITGGGTQLPGLCEYLQKTLGIEAKELDFTDTVAAVAPDTSEDLFVVGTVAFGLALKGIGMASDSLEFRREEFAYTNRFELIKMPLAILITLSFLWVLLMCYHVQNKRFEHEQAVSTLAKRMKEVSTRTVPDISLPKDDSKLIKTIKKKMQRSFPEGGPPEVEDVFKLWKEIFEKFSVVQRRNFKDITLTKIELNPEEVSFEGMVIEQRYDRILNFLEKQMAKIENVESSKARLERQKVDDKRRYTMRIKVRKSDDE